MNTLKNLVLSQPAQRPAPAGILSGIGNLRSGRWLAAWRLGAALTLLGLAVPARAANVTYSQSTGNNDWSNSANWNPPPYPNISTDNVFISAVPVNLDVTVTIGSLTLTNGAAVDMVGGTTLNLTGSLSDNGSVVVNSNQSGMSWCIETGTKACG